MGLFPTKKQEPSAIELSGFVATKKIGNYLHIDEANKKWLVPDGLFGKVKNPKVYDYSDILDYELLEDGTSITSGNAGKAVLGGALLGGVGAIVGGSGKKKSRNICEMLKIKITVKDTSNPTQYINFLSMPMARDGIGFKSAYKNAQECASVLQVICNSQASAQPAQQQAPSVSDEIMKFKQLLDAGALTQEEYDEKKKQLLGV